MAKRKRYRLLNRINIFQNFRWVLEDIFILYIFARKIAEMKKLLLMICLLMIVGLAKAQKTCVIASAEDHVPIREALIHTDNNHWARTEPFWNSIEVHPLKPF